ncbi:uncharacterized protein LOC118182451 [Stegodyphus dumicola]|uniref:uncharacterized protein LOC118182451 n=1 Tax=Stegodyphus dumicola TaxID=202533 RepID=UPI0015AEDD67|nr:uncharacterized protein LOC118182451 [Stegodyphus dumicola]
MLLLWLWISALFLVVPEISTDRQPDLQSGIGMEPDHQPRQKRRPSESEENRQMVTIDLSALRPSLPGLVLYKYGDLAPKLVQVDIAALNPQLQPHIIWPQFDQMELIDDRPFDFGSVDAIPYLADEDSLMAPKHSRMAKMTAEEPSWPDNNDIYDFIPDNDDILSLRGSLPLAEEVIVPLDWEEGKTNRNSEKRNVFTSRGWMAGGQRDAERHRAEKSRKGSVSHFNVHYTPFGAMNWIPGKRKQDRETESEDKKDESADESGNPGKKNVFVSSGWGPGGRHATGHQRKPKGDEKSGANTSTRISSKESWLLHRPYWNVPHLFGSHWQ